MPRTPREYHNKSKNAQEAHEAVRPTEREPHTRARSPKYVDRDQARLYELIWNCAVASQMESAELERTTVDIVAKAGSRNIDLRASGQVVKFDGFLTLYQEGQDETQDDEEVARLPAMSRGRAAQQAGDRILAALHRAAAALFGSRLGQAHGRAGHRPALDLRLDPAGAARIAAYVRIDKKRLIPKTRAASSLRFPRELLYALRRVRFHRRARREARRRSRRARSTGACRARRFLDNFVGAVNDIKEVRNRVVLDALNDLLEPHISPRAKTAPIRAECPQCGDRAALAEDRALRRLHRLLELSGMQLHAADHAQGADGVRRVKVLGKDPEPALTSRARWPLRAYLQLGEQVKPQK